MTVRRFVSLLGIALCAAVVAGCGAADTLSFDPVAKAATKTASSTSARVSFSASMSMEGVGAMSFAGDGVFDGPARSGALNMTFNLPPSVQAQAGGNPRMEMIYDGSHGLVMYVRSPLFKTLPAGTWVKMDLKKLAGKAGVDLSGLMSANQADPSQTLRLLMASSDSHVVNYDKIRGVLTTHYAFRVDLKRLAKESKELRKALNQVIKISGVDSYPAEAWIDAQGRVRRIKVDMSLGSQMGAPNLSMTMTEDLYDFGVKANIRAPRDHVVDMSALAGH